jgi:MtN3 and saliva related transmembrane protein
MVLGTMSESVGLAAAALTTGSFFPQVYHIWRTRDAESISALMYIIFATGVAMWFAYGLAIHSPSVVIANATTFVLALTVLIMKFRFAPHPCIAVTPST